MIRPPFSADEASGTNRIQDLPASYFELLFGKRGLQDVIFSDEEDAVCWHKAMADVKTISRQG